MSAPRLIGLTGRAGAGKDTAAAHLKAAHGFTAIAFADPIRRALSAMLGLAPIMFQHPHKEEPISLIGKSPRQLMQTLGTEWGRNLVHPDIWLILAEELILTCRTAGECVVVTDVRFENEAALIRSLGGSVWHVDRSGAGTAHQHVSEAGVAYVPGYDVRLSNNGTVPMLHALIDGAFA